jgi:hypothetical protein
MYVITALVIYIKYKMLVVFKDNKTEVAFKDNFLYFQLQLNLLALELTEVSYSFVSCLCEVFGRYL